MSFVKGPDVINNLKSYISARASRTIEVIAKLESHDSVPNAQSIVEAADCVMVARGDLGTPQMPCFGNLQNLTLKGSGRRKKN